MLQEFKNFINKGNVLDLAVAVILGAAFGKIVGSLVEDIIMPIIGSIINLNFATWSITLKEAVLAADGKVMQPAILFGIGKFLQSILDFFLVAFPVFLIVRAANKAKLAAPPAPPTPTESLLTEIRDLLKK
jgi:large conductance mechanosensitive channel